MPLATAPPLSFGGVDPATTTSSGSWRSTAFLPELGAVDGFLSLAFFDEPCRSRWTTPRGVVIVESPASVEQRARDGAAVPVRLGARRPGGRRLHATRPPGGETVEVEIDMGSDSLILDERLAEAVGVDLQRDGVRRVEGQDETGHAYTRFVHAARRLDLARPRRPPWRSPIRR